jgi:RNA-directed DNA polymerase
MARTGLDAALDERLAPNVGGSGIRLARSEYGGRSNSDQPSGTAESTALSNIERPRSVRRSIDLGRLRPTVRSPNDCAWAESGTGELVRYADDFVVVCTTRSQAEHAQARATAMLGELGLELHPDKTRVVDLREGREGFDFLGCHFHARMSGPMWEKYGTIRYYLHRWPSQRSMKRARQRIKDLTSRSRVGIELSEVIADLNRFLRGWGNYFRTGNAHRKFTSLDDHVVWRLRRLLIKKRGRNLRAGQVARWTSAWFHDQGLHQLMGTIRYPKAA